uniref:Uncharacterized protein n=2 Tax=Physcomitrium patens TaxID=3218 RepID=A0A2K1KUN1_PHYPA|nr:hypothetical protein PHYPA_004499 [Physcomitrium patens]
MMLSQLNGRLDYFRDDHFLKHSVSDVWKYHSHISNTLNVGRGVIYSLHFVI